MPHVSKQHAIINKTFKITSAQPKKSKSRSKMLLFGKCQSTHQKSCNLSFFYVFSHLLDIFNFQFDKTRQCGSIRDALPIFLQGPAAAVANGRPSPRTSLRRWHRPCIPGLIWAGFSRNFTGKPHTFHVKPPYFMVKNI